MAVNPTVTRPGDGDGSLIQYSYSLTTATPDGTPFEVPEWADVTWVFRGTWGGATAKVQGSADGTNFVATGLSNAAGGTEGSASADKIYTTIERPRYMRPNLTTVGAGAEITAVALCRRTNTMRT